MDAQQEVRDPAQANRTIFDRMIGAATFNVPTYEEVEAEKSSIGQATLVVLLACSAGALGTWLRDVGLAPVPVEDAPFRIVLDLVEPLFFWLAGRVARMEGGRPFPEPGDGANFQA